MKVLLFTGFSGFTHRLDNTFHLLQQERELAIDCLLWGKANHKYLLDQGRADYNNLHCIDEFLDEYKDDIKNNSFIEKIDYKLCKTKHNRMAYVGRNMVQHTHFSYYSRDVDHQKIKYYITFMYNKLMPIVSVVDKIFCYTCASIESEIIYDLSKELKIPFLTLNEHRIGYRWSVNDNNIDIHNESLKEYTEGSTEPSPEGIKYYEETIKLIKTGNKNVIEKKFQGKRIESKKIAFKNVVNLFRNLLFLKEDLPFAPTRMQRINANINFKFREYYIKRNLGYKIPQEPFIYFAMPMVPEATTLIRNPENYDILGLIKRISFHIPLNCKLVVREHPSMIGTTPVKFYKEIQKIYNIILLSPLVSNYECIKNSQITITNTGTVGLESLLLLKKTLVLGNTMYSSLKSVFTSNDLSKIDKIIELDNETHKNEQEADLKWYYSCLYKNSFEDTSQVLWSREAFNKEILETDINMKNHIKFKF